VSSYKEDVKRIFAAAARKAAKDLEGFDRAIAILKKREENERHNG